MANVTIPNLPSASNIVPSTDLLILEQTNGTRKATIDQIFVNANLPTITYSTWQGYTDEQKGDYVGYISGVPDEILNASSIAYDGTTSGSSNTNVQDELDKINAKLSDKTIKPNYEAKHNVVNTAYTATVDSWISIYYRGSSECTCDVYIDGNQFGLYRLWSDGGTMGTNSPQFYIPKGATISYQCVGATVYDAHFIVVPTV